MDIGIIYLVVAGILLLISTMKDPQKTKNALKVTGKIAITVLPVLFLIFILMGLVEAFVSKEAISAWLGSSSGVLSVLLGEILGCFALVQPAAVFPFAGYLHDSGAGYGAVLGFVMTAILIGVATLPLEIKLFGVRFALTRNVITFICIFCLGIIFEVVL